jgi:serine/threonine-protein kinase
MLALAAPGARAEQTDPVAAQALFDQGRAQMARGEYAEACPKLEESQRLSPAAGTAFNLAECWTHTGRLASAWSLFRDVEAEAQLAQQPGRALVARRHADALVARLPHLLIQVQSPTDAIEVRRDGILVGRAQWNTDVPVDIGPHAVTAAAPGHKPWRGAVRVEAEAQSVTVVVPELPPEVSAPAVPPEPPPLPPPPRPSDVAPATAPAPASPRTAAVVVGAGGLALLAASGVTVAIAVSSYHSAGPCTGTVCFTDTAVSQRDHARTLGDVATGLAIAGGVALAGGVVLWLATGHGGAATAERRTAFGIGVAPAGLTVRAIW